MEIATEIAVIRIAAISNRLRVGFEIWADRPPKCIPLPHVERGEKTPTPKISALLRQRPVLLRANLNYFVLTKDRKRPY